GKRGVGSIEIFGGRKRQIRVDIDPRRLDAHRVSISEVSQAIARENLELPGGTVTQGTRTFQVRVPGRVKSAAELAHVPVSMQQGYVVRVGDVATVSDASEEAESLANI